MIDQEFGIFQDRTIKEQQKQDQAIEANQAVLREYAKELVRFQDLLFKLQSELSELKSKIAEEKVKELNNDLNKLEKKSLWESVKNLIKIR